MKREVLEKKILEAQKAYYEDSNPIMTDKEFDELYDKLKKEFPESSILKSVGDDKKEGFEKAPHNMIIGSQEKFNTEEGLKNWIRTKNIQFPIFVEYKLDGLSVEIQYEEGVLKKAITRGNGYIGDDITENVKKMRGVKEVLPNRIGRLFKFTGSLRGEILMEKTTFREKYKYQGFSNPRNLASGIAKSKEGKNCSDLVVVFYDAFFEGNPLRNEKPFRNEYEILEFLKDIPVFVTHYKSVFSVEELLQYRRTVDKNLYDFEFDGLVLKQFEKVKSDLERLRPEYQRAFKWKDEGKETIVKDVIWNRQGSTYTPVAILEPTKLDGSIVSRASLGNVTIIQDLNLKIGDRVYITKRGSIIPKIEYVIKSSFKNRHPYPPTSCEVCGGHLYLENGKILRCSNTICPGKNEHRIKKWIDVLEVKGFGEVLLNTVFSLGVEKISDLYEETLLQKVLDSTSLKEATMKAFKDLYSKKEIPLEKFIAGFDIEGIGEKLIKPVVYLEKFNTLEKLSESTIEEFKELEQFNYSRAQVLFVSLLSLKEDMYKVIEYIDITNPRIDDSLLTEDFKSLSNLKICITGKLTEPRKEIEKRIVENGGTPVSSVNSKTDILVCNDFESKSSKMKKAKELNKEIWSEEKLFEKINDK